MIARDTRVQPTGANSMQYRISSIKSQGMTNTTMHFIWNIGTRPLLRSTRLSIEGIRYLYGTSKKLQWNAVTAVTPEHMHAYTHLYLLAVCLVAPYFSSAVWENEVILYNRYM